MDPETKSPSPRKDRSPRKDKSPRKDGKSLRKSPRKSPRRKSPRKSPRKDGKSLRKSPRKFKSFGSDNLISSRKAVLEGKIALPETLSSGKQNFLQHFLYSRFL